MARGDGGLGKADPWPDNDTPIHEQDPSPHQHDGYANRLPGGGHYEGGSDYWLDCMVYPERPEIGTGNSEGHADFDSRMFRVNLGNLTGKKVGPSTD
jgi:hypothetical protein